MRLQRKIVVCLAFIIVIVLLATGILIFWQGAPTRKLRHANSSDVVGTWSGRCMSGMIGLTITFRDNGTYEEIISAGTPQQLITSGEWIIDRDGIILKNALTTLDGKQWVREEIVWSVKLGDGSAMQTRIMGGVIPDPDFDEVLTLVGQLK